MVNDKTHAEIVANMRNCGALVDQLQAQARADADLVERAVRAAGSHGGLRWVCVKRAFTCGSTRAHELCMRFGLDPDEDLV